MSPRLNEEQLIAKMEADIEARKAKLAEKEAERKKNIASQITTKEALILKIESDFDAQAAKLVAAKDAKIAKLDAEILRLTEQLGVAPLADPPGEIVIEATDAAV